MGRPSGHLSQTLLSHLCFLTQASDGNWRSRSVAGQVWSITSSKGLEWIKRGKGTVFSSLNFSCDVKKSKNRKFATQQRRNVVGVIAVSGREIVFFV